MLLFKISSNRSGIPLIKKQPKSEQIIITSAFTKGPSIFFPLEAILHDGYYEIKRNEMQEGRFSRQTKPFPGVGRTVFTVLVHPGLFIRGIRCVSIVLRKFFLFQYRAALFPRLPVSIVEHSLDDHIPFNPSFVKIYLDFSAFWIRIVGFLCIGYGKKGRKLAAEFISSITELYNFAFQVYKKNLSTTNRPCYKKGFHFRLIHLVDPHLMCIPSLHVMLVVRSYTAFNYYLGVLGEEKTLSSMAERVFNGALAITEAILYVKQHSINCIAAALYAMNRFDPAFFGPKEAEKFVRCLFTVKEPKDIPPEYAPFYSGPLVNPDHAAPLREHIVSLFRLFLERNSADWTAPILEFLKKHPLSGRKKEIENNFK